LMVVGGTEGGVWMQRHCDGTDPDLLAYNGTPCTCGLEFDDTAYTVFYPHLPITGRLTEQQRADFFAWLGGSVSA